MWSTFDCLPHDLLITKLHAYGSDVNINNTYSSWSEILFGVQQGSILGRLLFIFFLCDLFLFVPDIGIVNYADDNTPHATNKHLATVLKEIFMSKIKNWIPQNCSCKLCKTYFQRIGYVQIANYKYIFMTIRFRSGSTCPVTPGM